MYHLSGLLDLFSHKALRRSAACKLETSTVVISEYSTKYEVVVLAPDEYYRFAVQG